MWQIEIYEAYLRRKSKNFSSVFEITENTKNIFKSLSDSIESTVKDESIRLASRDLIQSIQEEFELTLKKSKKRISDYINTKDPLEEE